MILSLLRKSARGRVIHRLHGEIVAAARQPALYMDFGIGDTFEGRFESLVLHVSLVRRRLLQLAPPGPELGHGLVDACFAEFDGVLREAGIGDPAVPKRMQKLAEAFYGRNAAYDVALAAPDDVELEAALTRNIYGGARRPEVARLSAHVRRIERCLAAVPVDAFTAGQLAFPDPAEA